MARTRAQDKATESRQKKPTSKSEEQNEVKSKKAKKATEPDASKAQKSTKPAGTKSAATKRSRKDEPPQTTKGTKKRKTSSDNESKPKPETNSTSAKLPPNSKISSLISKYGSLPLQSTALPPTSLSQPLPSTLLALVFNAMLTSTRISHSIAARSVSCLIEAGYHEIKTLQNSSWEERTEVLTRGGYTHYREKTATMLGELTEVIMERYQGDLNNMLKETGSEPVKIRKALKEIKGIGEVGLDIFFDSAQGVWPCLAPFLDPRSAKTAEQIGLVDAGVGGQVAEELWRQVGEDPMEMCKLASALTTVRLEKKVGEFSA